MQILSSGESYQERELLSRVSMGDNAAFKELYLMYSGRVFSFIHIYLKEEMIAEDLVQTIFLRCWEKRVELRALHSLKDFLFIIARNQVYDHLRRMAARTKRLEDVRLQSWYQSQPSGSALEEKELRELYLQAIERLPAQQRDVYRRHAEQEQSLDEIARDMNLAKSTVKKHLEVARRSVRTHILHRTTLSIAVPLLVATGDSFFF